MRCPVPSERQQIIHLIGQLSADNEQTRLNAEHVLVGMGECALKLLGTALGVVPSGSRPTLIGILRRIGGPRALTILMRYVFDARADVTASLERAQAMQAIMELARPQDETRLFAFLVDLSPEPDELVRTYVVECFSRLRDPRALTYIRAAFQDPSPFVRERANRALQQVQGTQQLDPLQLCAEDFLRLFLGADDVQRERLKASMIQHVDAFDLGSALVRQDAEHALFGLEVLSTLGDPRAREVALRHLLLTRTAVGRTAGMQLLAEHLHADARPPEVRAIEAGLADADRFVRLAALAAAARAGEARLVQVAIQATRAEDTISCAVAAGSLAHVAALLPACWARELLQSADMARSRRRFEPQKNLAMCEAALLSALGALLNPWDEDARAAQLSALASLKEGSNWRTLTDAAIDALERLTPVEGYPSQLRWHPADAVGLVALLEHPEIHIQRRALELIRRAAPGDTPGLLAHLERWMSIDPCLVVKDVIPAVAPSAGMATQTRLYRLARSQPAPPVATARAQLRATVWLDDFTGCHAPSPTPDDQLSSSLTSSSGQPG